MSGRAVLRKKLFAVTSLILFINPKTTWKGGITMSLYKRTDLIHSLNRQYQGKDLK